MRFKVGRLSLNHRVFIMLLPALFLGVFYFYPLARICLVSFVDFSDAGPDWIRKLFSSPHYIRVIWFTFWQAALSTLLTVITALPGAWVFARYRFFGKHLIASLTTVPFVLPTVVVAAAFNALIGPEGIASGISGALGLPPIEIEHSVWLILLAHVFYNYTVVFKIVGGFWARLRPDMAEAARMLGASRTQAFFRVTLPLLKPALFTASMLVFTFCFSSFGVVLILGGPALATLEVEIYRQAVYLFNLPMAAVLSIIQIVFTFTLMSVYTRLQAKSAFSLHPATGNGSAVPCRSFAGRLVVLSNSAFMLLLLGAPLFALVFRSFSSESGLSLVYYRSLFENSDMSVFFVPPVAAVLNSLGFAAAATGMALVLGMAAAQYLAGDESRFSAFLDPLFMLPLSTSAVTLGFGFIVALGSPPLNLRTSLMLVPLAHTLVAFPFVVRSILPALRSIPSNLKEAASLLGASPLRVWLHVDLPIVGRALITGAVFAFTISMGEFGASVFVARPQTPTMPLAIYRFLGQPGALNYGQAMAMSSLLMLVTAAGFLFLNRIKAGNGEF